MPQKVGCAQKSAYTPTSGVCSEKCLKPKKWECPENCRYYQKRCSAARQANRKVPVPQNVGCDQKSACTHKSGCPKEIKLPLPKTLKCILKSRGHHEKWDEHYKGTFTIIIIFVDRLKTSQSSISSLSS